MSMIRDSASNYSIGNVNFRENHSVFPIICEKYNSLYIFCTDFA